MKRTRVLSLLLAVLVAIAFASCRPDEPRTAPRGTSASGAQAVEEWLATWQEDLEFDDPGAVVRASERAFAEHPELARRGEAVALAARALIATGRFAEARERLRVASDVDAASRRFLTIESANLALAQDDLAGAVALLASPADAVQLRPELAGEPRALYLLGQAHARSGRLVDASALLHAYLERAPVGPEIASAWYLVAREAAERGDLQSAAEYRKRAEAFGTWYAYYRARRLQLREDPSATLPRIGLALQWLQFDQPSRAREELQRVIELEPENGQALGLLAEAERKLGNTRDALTVYDRALVFVDDPAMRLNRGLLRLEAGRITDARADLEQVAADPRANGADAKRYAAAHLALARIADAEARPADADEHYARYRELGGTEPR